MKLRLADYIAGFLADNGISDCFMITGGGAMHLNDAIGHHEDIDCTFCHHEQACAIAAESYARLSGRIAAVCVTSGPGGTNAVTGVMGAWVDSVPMLVISGQVKRETTIAACPELELRQLGDQEFDIVHTVANMTKYAAMVTEPDEIAWHLEKALQLALSGRRGPVWLDIPLDVQGAVIDTDDLIHYAGTKADGSVGHDAAESIVTSDMSGEEVPHIASDTVRDILGMIKQAKRPLVLAGTGIRHAGAGEEFGRLLDILKIPALTAWNANDLVPYDSPWFAGMPGTVGTRPGNFALQNCDLLLSLGCRINIRMAGYTHFDFARNARIISVDIDKAELLKPTLRIDVPVHGDVKEFIALMSEAAASDSRSGRDHSEWLARCKELLCRYPAVLPEYHLSAEGTINPYVFIDELFDALREGDRVICSNGSACVITFQAARMKAAQRMYTNSGCASMGYGLPAAVGAAVAERSHGSSDTNERIICIEGDGSLMMNLQEMATAAGRGLDIRMFVINNNGYHSMRQTQKNLFDTPFTGIDPASGVTFPDFSLLAEAFGWKYHRISSENECKKTLSIMLSDRECGPVMCEVMADPAQDFEPKVSSRILPDGSIVSPTLDDMAPFLPRSEYDHYSSHHGT